MAQDIEVGSEGGYRTVTIRLRKVVAVSGQEEIVKQLRNRVQPGKRGSIRVLLVRGCPCCKICVTLAVAIT